MENVFFISEFINAFDQDATILYQVKLILEKYNGDCNLIKDLANSINIPDNIIMGEINHKVNNFRELNIRESSNRNNFVNEEYQQKATTIMRKL